MAKAENEGVDAPRQVWEWAISEMGEKIGQAIQSDEDPERIAEMQRLKEFVVNSYKLRFGNPYPEPEGV